ncbi:MFS general substrate transporter [Lophiostoma macrostomum CBS 122681]|uniref:MFS general substrate transporter n=1 Tax=Lophiostoma macrostomum CBS 122681 TaxID=1314788 RepID=A0A6A6SNF7_9PLEO|nr:MFS general substrate transporter [Lophiostoma macrostomum CBS 122681]
MALYAVTSICGGLQMIWSVVLANGTPYLLSLGLPASLTALTWMAGPLCGIFGQPIFGVLSDNHAGKYGRRRPFILLGAVCVMLSVVCLASIAPLASAISTIFALSESAHDTLVALLALATILALNLSIQPLQMGMRALIVDLFPQTRQSRANTWASYWVGCGNIVGYSSGLVTLPQMLRLRSWTQFQCLCLVACLALCVTVGIGCAVVKEKRMCKSSSSWRRREGSVGVAGIYRRLRGTYANMSSRTRSVCTVQFFSWMAWFPFLYYGSTYASELFVPGHVEQSATTAATAAVHHLATRVGTLGFLSFACASLLASISLHVMVASSSSLTLSSSSPPSSSLLSPSLIRSRTIARIWTLSHIAHALALSCTFLLHSWRLAVPVYFYIGLSFGATQFAPFALIGLDCARTASSSASVISPTATDVDSQGGEDEDEDEDEDEEVEGEDEGEEKEKAFKTRRQVDAGAIMGLHNIAISAPQLVAAGMCAIVLALCKALGSETGIVWCLRLSVVPAVAAAWQSRRLVKSYEDAEARDYEK